MKPAAISPPVYTLAAKAAPPAAPECGASAAGKDLSQVSNQPKVTESSKGGVMGRVANAFSGMRVALGGASNARSNISAPTMGGAAASSLAAPSSQALTVSVAAKVFSNASSTLTPLLYASAPTRSDSEAFAAAFQTLGSGLSMLDKRVADSAGRSIRLIDVSDTLAAQVKSLLAMPIAKGDAKGIWGRVQNGENVLAKPQTRLELMRYLDDVKNVIAAFSQETGDTEVVKQVQHLFQDPLASELLSKLGTTNQQSGQFKVLMDSGDYRHFPVSQAGVRYKDIPVHAEKAMQLADGRSYMAHRMMTSQGDDLGTALNYPKPQDMPQYLQMLMATQPEQLVVLASSDEIEKLGFPPYFSTDATYSGYRVTSVAGALTHYGPLEVQHYAVTVRSPQGERIQFSAHHVLNWADKTTVPADALVDFSAALLAENGDMGHTIAHCKAGVGRTGTFLGVMGMMAHSLSAEKAITAMRADRSPWMVQTNAQLDTVVAAQREIELRARASPRQETRPAAAAEHVYANRVSLFSADIDAADDGEPVYQNVASGAYQNWSPHWADAGR